MDAFFAVRTLSSSVNRLVRDRNTGIAASGFATEKSEVKLASKSAIDVNKKEPSSGIAESEISSNISPKIERISGLLNAQYRNCKICIFDV